ncbi:MAG: hypothetical protein ACT6QS_07875 [Flavobacteriales bacterium]
MNNIYEKWDLKDNPFDTTALPALTLGNTLITGREDEIKRLTKRILNQPQIVTLEGENGIGKTSLINVSIYRLFMNYLHNKMSNPLFIPCRNHFQLSDSKTSEDLINEVFYEIAQTLINFYKDFKSRDLPELKNLHQLDKWLNQINLHNIESGISLGFFNTNYSLEQNTTPGFDKEGFINTIKQWLITLFPKKNYGGVICLIDNMELLETSENARKTIENLRDKLFNQHGIRWILCGSREIITNIATSPRLEGILHEPIIIESIPKMHIKDLFIKRIEYYKIRNTDKLPINTDSFRKLYDILKCNLRNTLNYSNSYCLWISDFDKNPNTDGEKNELFDFWLEEKANFFFHTISKRISRDAMILFNKLTNYNEGFLLEDYTSLGFNSRNEIENTIKELDKVGLLINLQDNSKVQITSKGWLLSKSSKKYT